MSDHHGWRAPSALFTRRVLMVTLAAIALAMSLLALTANRAPSPAATTSKVQTPAATPAWSPLPPSPAPTPLPATPRPMAIGSPLTRYPLELIAPVAVQLADASDAVVSVAAVVPGESTLYELRGDREFALLSVAKVPIMLALMDQAIREKRQLSVVEQYLLAEMIGESDNDAADALWARIGGGAGMRAFLRSAGLGHVDVPDGAWGDTIASPVDAATLLGLVLQGELLDVPMRKRVLELMGTVSPSQDWGALTGVPAPAVTGVKNGWYPERDGWQLNTLGFAYTVNAPGYAIALFTDGYTLLNEGIAAIEQLSLALNAAMQQPRPSPPR